MDNRVAVVGTLVIFGLLALAVGWICVHTDEFVPGGVGPGGEVPRQTQANDLAQQDAVEGFGGRVVRPDETSPVSEVSFADRPITDADLKVLGGLYYLRRIDLAGTRVTDACLAEFKVYRHLVRLDLSRTAVTGSRLAELTQMVSLSDLRLADTRVTDEALVGLRGLVPLARLDLSRTAVTGAGLAHLKGLLQLRSIRLAGAPVTDAGLAGLRAFHRLTASEGGSRTLDLSDTAVTDAGVEALWDFDLGELTLSRTKVTGRVVPVLASFPRLKVVTIEGTGLTPEELLGLKRALSSR